MRRDRAIWLILAIALIVVGALVGRRVNDRIETRPESDFRTWFWSHRSLDLAIQIGLVFAGAMGVAAVLPRAREENNEEMPP